MTGKSLECGGSKGRDKATGQGTVFCIEEWARLRNVDLSKCTFVVQGFGNAGTHSASLLAQHGSKLLATCNSRQAIYNENGIDADDLIQWYSEHRDLASYPKAEEIPLEDLLTIKCDILIPAALENQITAENANDIHAKCIAEAANGPLTLEADDIMVNRGIDVIPDILCNAGGVIVSYFEWVQNKNSEEWDLETIDGKLERRIKAAFGACFRHCRAEKRLIANGCDDFGAATHPGRLPAATDFPVVSSANSVRPVCGPDDIPGPPRNVGALAARAAPEQRCHVPRSVPKRAGRDTVGRAGCDPRASKLRVANTTTPGTLVLIPSPPRSRAAEQSLPHRAGADQAQRAGADNFGMFVGVISGFFQIFAQMMQRHAGRIVRHDQLPVSFADDGIRIMPRPVSIMREVPD